MGNFLFRHYLFSYRCYSNIQKREFSMLKKQNDLSDQYIGSYICVFIVIIYLLCVLYSNSSLPEKYILLSFGYMALIFPASGYCYFESLVNENEYKLVMEQKKLSPEYSTWKKKKKVFVYMEFAMIVIVLVSIIGLQQKQTKKNTRP